MLLTASAGCSNSRLVAVGWRTAGGKLVNVLQWRRRHWRERAAEPRRDGSRTSAARGVVRSSVRMCVRARLPCVSACVRLNGEGQPALARRRVNNRFSRSSAFFILHTPRETIVAQYLHRGLSSTAANSADNIVYQVFFQLSIARAFPYYLRVFRTAAVARLPGDHQGSRT